MDDGHPFCKRRIPFLTNPASHLCFGVLRLAGERPTNFKEVKDMSTKEGPSIRDGARIDPADIPAALTRAPLTYDDGATQVFTPDGRTVYTENGTRSPGEWKVDDNGRFQSFWPPSYYATYDVSWIGGPDGDAAGIRFADATRGTTFDGRYALRRE